MKHTIRHDLGIELATKATKAAFETYRRKFAKFAPQAQWRSANEADILFKVKMAKLKGRLEINDDRIDMDLDVPLVLRVFRDRAIRAIDTEVRAWIEKAKNGELD